MKTILKYKKKKISIEIHKCNWLEKIIGLMFSNRKSAKPLLLFNFKKPHRMKIHSFFVFFPFLAVWLDSDGKVIEKQIIKPWKLCILPKKKFTKLVEIPLNKKNSKVVKFLVGDAKDL